MCKLCNDPQHPSSQPDWDHWSFLKAGVVNSVPAMFTKRIASSVSVLAQTIASASAKFQGVYFQCGTLRPDDALIKPAQIDMAYQQVINEGVRSPFDIDFAGNKI